LPASAHYDVIINGIRADGGILTRRLAPSGKRALLLKQSVYVPREKANWVPRLVYLEAKYHAKEVRHDRGGGELHPDADYYVGGNTGLLGAALLRLCKEDLGETRD
jgi:hypothetical protein